MVIPVGILCAETVETITAALRHGFPLSGYHPEVGGEGGGDTDGFWSKV